MADQGRWFKLWCDADDDDALDALDMSDFGRWCKLGLHIKKHGTGGKVTIVSPARTLCAKFQVPDFDMLCTTIQRLPHVHLRREKTVTDASVTAEVEFRNWKKYQEDTSWLRMRRMRDRVTPKRRGEEKRRDKEKDHPLKPPEETDEADPWSCSTCVQILTLLNDLTARTYDGSGKGFSLLHAAHERHGRQSCVEVVQRKVEQWKDDPKRARYLRPETLFDPTHFDGYRNETDTSAAAPGHTQPKATKKDIEDLNRWRAKRGEAPIPLPENG